MRVWSLGSAVYIGKCIAIITLSWSPLQTIQAVILPHNMLAKPYNPKGPSTQLSYTRPTPVLQLLLPKSQVPNYWVLGPLGQCCKTHGFDFGCFRGVQDYQQKGGQKLIRQPCTQDFKLRHQGYPLWPLLVFFLDYSCYYDC